MLSETWHFKLDPRDNDMAFNGWTPGMSVGKLPRCDSL